MAELGLMSTLAKSLSLGGGMPTIHSSTYHILSVLCISMIRFLALLCFSCFYFHFPKHKKTKNISVVSLCLPFWFSSFGLLYFLFSVWYSKKSKNILLCLPFPSVLVAKFKNPKIFVVLLQFCKVCCRVQSSVTPLELGIHFILFKPHK
jgi:hypothetical protein